MEENLLAVLPVVDWGMAGIFLVTGILIAGTALLNRLPGRKQAEIFPEKQLSLYKKQFPVLYCQRKNQAETGGNKYERK